MSNGADRRTFFGKYQGVVSDNRDPDKRGRIKARVVDIFGDDESGWALPCAPFGGFCALPKVGAGVWIEFMRGDPDYPIWSGCWWGAGSELPSVLGPSPEKKVVLETEGGNRIIFDDSPGSSGIILETAGGQKIKLTSNGIELDNGNGATIKLSGSSVNVNSGALEVQ